MSNMVSTTSPVTITWGSNSYSGYNIPPGESKPARTPPGLLITRAVQVVEGWVGQILVDKNIPWQSEPVEDEDDALKAANDRVVDKLCQLFAE